MLAPVFAALPPYAATQHAIRLPVHYEVHDFAGFIEHSAILQYMVRVAVGYDPPQQIVVIVVAPPVGVYLLEATEETTRLVQDIPPAPALRRVEQHVERMSREPVVKHLVFALVLAKDRPTIIPVRGDDCVDRRRRRLNALLGPERGFAR